MRQLSLGVKLRDRATFESFHPGGNHAVVAFLTELTAGEQRVVGWLCGPAGSGKSHLLQAVCAAAPAGSAVYLPLAQLASMGPELLEGWQECRVLCIDDLHTVIGQMNWERALFALYRELEERGAVLVMAAGDAPAHLPFVLRDLASRCGAATLFALQPLDETEQREALRLRARLRGLELPEETAVFLQRRLPRDMDSLYHLLDTLDDAALQAQRRLTIPFIREVLAQRPA